MGVKTATLIEWLEAAEAMGGPQPEVRFMVGPSTGIAPAVLGSLRRQGFDVSPNPRGGWVLRRPPKTEAKYIVVNRCELAYRLYGEQEGMIDILHSKPQFGGRDCMNGPYHLSPTDQIRSATLADFEYYRVCPKGHIA